MLCVYIVWRNPNLQKTEKKKHSKKGVPPHTGAHDQIEVEATSLQAKCFTKKKKNLMVMCGDVVMVMCGDDMKTRTQNQTNTINDTRDRTKGTCARDQ